MVSLSTQKIIFLIVTYHPNDKFKRLKESLTGYPVLTLDNSVSNLGYAARLNIGLKKILEKNYDWIILVNQDLELTKKSLTSFLNKLSSAAADLLGAFPGNLDPQRYSTILPATNLGLIYLSGELLAIRKNVFKKIGLWEEKYFLYYEDVDFCQRAIKSNLRLEYITLSGVRHEESLTLGKNSFLHQYYLARNHLLFVEKWAPLSVKIHELLRLPKTIYEHWVRKEKGALLGIRDYFLRRFGQRKT